MKQKSDQMEKARIGAIGENNVVSILMQYGWDAFNANCTIKNYKSIDIVCLNNDVPESIDKPWKPSMALVQVKTCTQSNIPVGFTIEEALDKDYLYNNVRGHTFLCRLQTMAEHSSSDISYCQESSLLNCFMPRTIGIRMIGTVAQRT